MRLEVVSTERRVFEGKVSRVLVPGSKGPFEILRNHAPIVSTLNAGTIKIIDNSGMESLIEVKGGLVEVNNNSISILVESV